MRIIICILFMMCVLTRSAEAHREFSIIAIRAQLVADLAGSVPEVIIVLAGDKKVACNQGPPPERGKIDCHTVVIDERPERIQVVIRAHGFEHHVRNIPRISYQRDAEFRRHWGRIELGIVTMVRPPLYIRSVIAGIEGDSTYRFQMSVRSNLSRVVSVNRLLIRAYSRSGCLRGPIGDPAVLKIDSKLSVYPTTERTLAVRGHISERSTRPGVMVPINGQIYYHPCIGLFFELIAPVDQELSPGSTYSFDLVLPRAFVFRLATGERRYYDEFMREFGERSWPFRRYWLVLQTTSTEVPLLTADLKLPNASPRARDEF